MCRRIRNSKNTSVVIFVDLVQRVGAGVSSPGDHAPHARPPQHARRTHALVTSSASKQRLRRTRDHGGFVELLVKLNDKVEAGQGVAIQRNTFGEVVAEYTSGVTGEVACHSTDESCAPTVSRIS